MDNTTYNVLTQDVDTAARTVARDWPGVIEEDDLRQEIWLVLLDASQEAQSLVAGMSQAQRVSTLQTYGHRIAAKERDDYDLFSGNFFYSVNHVKDLLEAGALTRLESDPGTLMHSERIDLTAAMGRLPTKNARYAFLIGQAYVNGVKLAHEDPDRRALARAVDSLTTEMNRSNRSRIVAQHDGPGSRKAMSNESAIRMTRNDYRGA